MLYSSFLPRAGRPEGPIPQYASQGKYMEQIADYRRHALFFDRLAAEELDLVLKNNFEAEAKGYRRMAAWRAEAIGVELPLY
jgi:hypothetical protein